MPTAFADAPRRATWRSALLTCCGLACGTPHAAYLLDTGQPTKDNWNSLVRSAALESDLGAALTIDSATTISEVDGWMRISKAGDLTVSLWSGAPSLNATPLFSATRSLAANNAGHWESFTDLNWSVGPGSYSVTFTPVLGFSGSMAQGAPQPASSYYYFACFINVRCNDDWLPASISNGNNLGLGFRVLDSTAAVPEPASSALALAGLTLLGLVAYQRRRSR